MVFAGGLGTVFFLGAGFLGASSLSSTIVFFGVGGGTCACSVLICARNPASSVSLAAVRFSNRPANCRRARSNEFRSFEIV